jgi:hypothetical protein
MEEAIETFEVNGKVVEIHRDETPSDPREDFDHLGKMACWHRRYKLGDEQPKTSLPDFRDSLPEGSVVISVSLLDHSGLHMYVGYGEHPCDPGGWDSGPVGLIYATPDTIRKEYDRKRISKKLRVKVEGLLRLEIEEYDQYLRGDVWGFVIKEDGEDGDSCWGFYGIECCREAAKEAAGSIAA